MIILIYILFLLKTFLCIEIQTNNTGYFLLKSEKCLWNWISYFDNELAYLQNGFNNLEPISHHNLPPLPFG